jgi:hypothetical protein
MYLKLKNAPYRAFFFYFAIGHQDLALLSCTSAELISSSPTLQIYKKITKRVKKQFFYPFGYFFNNQTFIPSPTNL